MFKSKNITILGILLFKNIIRGHLLTTVKAYNYIFYTRRHFYMQCFLQKLIQPTLLLIVKLIILIPSNNIINYTCNHSSASLRIVIRVF